MMKERTGTGRSERAGVGRKHTQKFWLRWRLIIPKKGVRIGTEVVV